MRFDPLDSPRNLEDSRNHEIWEVCRATTAAPTYFKPMMIDGNYYSDGGTEANNPTVEAMREIRLLHPGSLKLIASFGTGKANTASIFIQNESKHPHVVKVIDRSMRLGKRAKAALVESEKTHGAVDEFFKHYNGAEYRRFNVEKRLGKMKLNEWKTKRDAGAGDGTKCSTLRYIEICTEAELQKESVQKALRALADQLVKQRRQRTRDIGRWDRFATCSLYKCHNDRCRLDGKLFSCAIERDMRDHIRMVHPESSTPLEERLQRCRTEPDFPAGPF